MSRHRLNGVTVNRGSRARGAAATALLFVGTTLLMLATTSAASPSDVPDAPPAVRVLPVPVIPTSPSGTSSSAPPPVVAMPRSTPVSITIPAIGVQSTLVPLGITANGRVQVPPLTQVMQAGWYDQGPTPGEDGPAVILGHVDGYHNIGVFYRLHDLAAGDLVFVARQDHTTATFQVSKVDLVSKNAFPTDAVYDNTPDPELRLITCGGSFDWTQLSYRDNVIVYAHLVHQGP